MELRRQRERVLDGIDLSRASGLEIGPLARPLVDKRQGHRVKYVDHDATDALKARFAIDPNVRVDDIVDVDYVISGEVTILDIVHEKFDYVLASHVFEHVPNPIRWLQEMYELLNPGGRLALIIPDRRFTFDIIRPQTSLGEMLEAYYCRRKRPTFRDVFDQNYYWRNVDVPQAWLGQFNPWTLKPPLDQDATLSYAQTVLETSEYVDVHCTVVSDTEMHFLFSSLVAYDLTKFRVANFLPCEPNDNEFFLILEKPKA